MDLTKTFDLIVVGGGHAGTEAALAAARMGVQTLLLTHNLETLGQMSCNPSIGGIGKGHLVKEIDALGGCMALAADHAGIQFRTLNARKGPAVRATRAQADRALYRQYVRCTLEQQPNLVLFQQGVDDLLIRQGKIIGVRTQMGLQLMARTVVLTVGTFLDGRIHIGAANYPGGRAGDPPARALAERLRALGFQTARLKTGTPPRLAAGSLDFTRMQEQPGDQPTPVFSFMGAVSDHPTQIPCHITATNARTHELIRQSLDRSPLFSGQIEGVGPRYCPSIEDKVVRFAERTSHQLFVEPEGLHSGEIYPNGISTSLPFDVQIALVRSIKGFEKAHITRPGYAIEYDYFDPRGLEYSLQTKHVKGLFFAGQINGTTGYEEAAAQGLIAGINAALQVHGEAPWCPRRDEAYIGVMIDDLITLGTLEPYRMFTSRAEHRLLLREDNADLRLTPKGQELGLVDASRWAAFTTKRTMITAEAQRLQQLRLLPAHCSPAQLAQLGGALSGEQSLWELLRRPSVEYAMLMSMPNMGPGVGDQKVAEQVEVQAKYAGYIERQKAEIQRHRSHQEKPLPEDLRYADILGLSNEVREKFTRQRPVTVGQAARIPGVTPAAISLLLVHLKKRA